MESPERTLYRAIAALSVDADDGIASAARSAIYAYHNARTSAEIAAAVHELLAVIDTAGGTGQYHVARPARAFYDTMEGRGAAAQADL